MSFKRLGFGFSVPLERWVFFFFPRVLKKKSKIPKNSYSPSILPTSLLGKKNKIKTAQQANLWTAENSSFGDRHHIPPGLPAHWWLLGSWKGARLRHLLAFDCCLSPETWLSIIMYNLSLVYSSPLKLACGAIVSPSALPGHREETLPVSPHPQQLWGFSFSFLSFRNEGIRSPFILSFSKPDILAIPKLIHPTWVRAKPCAERLGRVHSETHKNPAPDGFPE